MFVLKRADIACRQQMTTVNLLQKHFKQLQYYTVWYYNKLVLCLVTTAVSNQIKYYVTTNRGNFLEMQYGFYRKLCFAGRSTNDLSLKEHLQRTHKRLEQDCSKHHCKKSLRLCDWSSTQVSLFLLTGEAGIVNVQGCGIHRYLS